MRAFNRGLRRVPKDIRRVRDWWKMRRDPLCRIIDAAHGMSTLELKEGAEYLTALRDSLTFVAPKRRIFLHPGPVRSRTDGDSLFVHAGPLAVLYEVRLQDCLTIDDANPVASIGYKPRLSDIHLYPLASGDYRPVPADVRYGGEG